MSNEGVIKLKGDNTHLDSATDKSANNFKKLGEHASKAHGHAKSFGEQWQHANTHMIRTLAHGLSIFGVLERIVEKTKEFQEESERAAKAVGSIAVTRDRAAAKLGISNETAAGLVGGMSPVSMDDRAKFFGGLADKKFGRGKRDLTSQQTAQVMQAFNSGLYDEKEIDEALTKGDLSKLMHVGDRRSALSPEGRKELNARAYINQENDSAEEAMSQRGTAYAVAGAHFKNVNAHNPLSASNILSQVPLVGTAGEALYKMSVGASSARAAEGDGSGEVRAAIENQTEELKRDRPPTVARPAGGD